MNLFRTMSSESQKVTCGLIHFLFDYLNIYLFHYLNIFLNNESLVMEKKVVVGRS